MWERAAAQIRERRSPGRERLELLNTGHSVRVTESQDWRVEADAQVARAVAERRRELRRRGTLAWLATGVLGGCLGLASATVRWGGEILAVGAVGWALASTWLFIAYVRAVSEVDD